MLPTTFTSYNNSHSRVGLDRDSDGMAFGHAGGLMIDLHTQIRSGARVLLSTMALVLWLLLGCTNRPGIAPDLYPSVAEVRTPQIAVPAHARNIVHDEQRDSIIDEVTKITTYTTAESVELMTTYYQDLFRTLGWKPYGVGPGPLEAGPGDLIFGQGGRDGQKPGDPLVTRNVSISLRPCGDETCVSIKDALRQMTVPEPFN
jgi:hypothetical protein